jgi:adenylate kinase
MILIFIGPPFAGKDTQAKLLSSELDLPVFSMGAVIREAYEKRDPRAIEGFEKYSLKGLHVPINKKFDLLRDKIDSLNDFILDNFPANEEDLVTFNQYLEQRNLSLTRVIYLKISEEEMKNRLVHRGRGDDDPSIVEKRREVQDADREPVLKYFMNKGLLLEIDGSQPIDKVHEEIKDSLK